MSGPYLAVHFRTEKWSSEAAGSAGCWAHIGLGIKSALAKHGLSTVFIGADVGHSVSYGALVRQQQQVGRHIAEQLVKPLESMGVRVIVG